jgi:4-hydroxy-tetrahydrodipicolinate synthase
MLRGVFTAMVTPFGRDGEVDEISLRRLVDEQIESGINGLVPCGTTGESPTLNHEEHHRVVEIVINQAKGQVPVIAGTGSNSTKEAVSLTKHAKDAGAAAALVVAPYYNKPTQHALINHYNAIADVGLPVIVYNIQGRTGINIETATLMEIAKHPSIAGVKEASGSVPQMMDVLGARPKDFAVLSGDDNLTFPLMTLGGDGIISVIANLIPARISEFVSLCLEGKWDEARNEHFELMPLFKAMFIETNPVPVKAAMAIVGKVEEKYRSPMEPMQDENKEKLKSLMSKFGLI